MNNTNSEYKNQLEEDDSFDLTNDFFKYLFFWKYFLASLLIFSCIAFLVNRYTELWYNII